MKCLIYGSGVMGSYVAHILMKNPSNEVSMIARGEWAETLGKYGLRVVHYPGKDITQDRPKVITAPVDKYDIAFVSLQSTQLNQYLEKILDVNTRTIVYVGNTMDAEEIAERTEKAGKTAIFGFCAAAGRREDGMVHIGHYGKGTMSIGKVHEGLSAAETYELELAFLNTGFTLRHFTDMDGWLKCHVATLLPVAALAYYRDRNLYHTKLSERKLVHRASSEAFRLLEACGVALVPYGYELYFSRFSLRHYFYAAAEHCIFRSRYGEFYITDHLKFSGKEMKLFYEKWKSMKDEKNMRMPAWEKLMSLVDWNEIAEKY